LSDCRRLRRRNMVTTGGHPPLYVCRNILFTGNSGKPEIDVFKEIKTRGVKNQIKIVFTYKT